MPPYGLPYGRMTHIISLMKTTVEIDEKRLASVMKLTGLRTRKAAVDYALRAAERSASLDRLMEEALPDEAYRTAVDPHYDVVKLRKSARS